MNCTDRNCPDNPVNYGNESPLTMSLKEELRQKGEQPQDGDIIRFTWLAPAATPGADRKPYVYAAIFAGSHWYLTGVVTNSEFGSRKLRHRDFIDKVLASEDVISIEHPNTYEVIR